jgi:hypothetical protein
MAWAASALTTGKARSKCLWLSSESKWGTKPTGGKERCPTSTIGRWATPGPMASG